MTLAFVAAVILVVPFRGAVPSIAMGLVAVVGLASLLDRRAGPALAPAARPLAALLAGIVLWQALGLLARGPLDGEDAGALGSAAVVALLLPLTAAAARRDPGALPRLLPVLFWLGVAAALVSIAIYAATIASAPTIGIGLREYRLIPFGRARHAILGAGGLAAAFLAGLAVWRGGVRSLTVSAGLAVVAAAILLTQSRGPVIALALALVGLVLVGRLAPERRALAAVLWGLLCFAVPVALIAAEPWIVQWLCTGDRGLCRPSMRFDMWASLLGLIPERPLFGWGPSYRFGPETVGHAHNGLLGTAFFFGLPAALMFVAAMGLGLARAARLARGPLRDFCLAGLFFAATYLGTDLPNPFAFLNTHYLFLWLPLVAAVAASAAPGPASGPQEKRLP
jgi:O-antigen ligase